MKVWYLGHTSVREICSDFEICFICSFKSLNLNCCNNPLFNDLHPCCSAGKYYREVTKSDIFNL